MMKKRQIRMEKFFVLEKDNDVSGRIDINDLEWYYWEWDGDYRSEEIRKLRDKADVIRHLVCLGNFGDSF